jgi:hypothetical protein
MKKQINNIAHLYHKNKGRGTKTVAPGSTITTEMTIRCKSLSTQKDPGGKLDLKDLMNYELLILHDTAARSHVTYGSLFSSLLLYRSQILRHQS